VTLTANERRLLELVATAAKPVAMPAFFNTIHPPTFKKGAPQDDPARRAWVRHQLDLFDVSLRLWYIGLVEIVHPANGERPDLVVITDAGRAALGLGA